MWRTAYLGVLIIISHGLRLVLWVWHNCFDEIPHGYFSCLISGVLIRASEHFPHLAFVSLVLVGLRHGLIVISSSSTVPL